MNHFRRVIGYWLPLAVVLSGLCFFTYAAVQQNYRLNANDHQIELAQQSALALEQGKSPAEIVSANPVDVATSLSPFSIIFDASGSPVASSALLDGKIPTPPPGVLTAALKNGENRVTWQPRQGIRIAAVIEVYKTNTSSGFVLVGRSLREVEARIDNLTLMWTLTWVCALVASLAAVILSEYWLLHPKEKSV